MIDDCSNCGDRVGPAVCDALQPHRGRIACASSYHYLGESPSELAMASKGEPAVVCGLCLAAIRGHRGDVLRDRAA